MVFIEKSLMRVSVLRVYYLASLQVKVKHRSGDGWQYLFLHLLDVMSGLYTLFISAHMPVLLFRFEDACCFYAFKH